MTDKGLMLFEGSDDPEQNPVRFRECTVCGERIDILTERHLWWEPSDDSFTHKACRTSR